MDGIGQRRRGGRREREKAKKKKIEREVDLAEINLEQTKVQNQRRRQEGEEGKKDWESRKIKIIRTTKDLH